MRILISSATGWAKAFGLAGGCFEGDGEVAGVFLCEGFGCGETEDVGGFILAAEAAVELAEGSIRGDEDVDGSAKANGSAGAVEEARQGGRGELGFEAGGFDGDHWPGFNWV